jgi:hypothetical protein
MEIKFYYQIDFIDDAGFANYIDTFKEDELDKAKEHYQILSNALACLDKSTKYVLDMYAYIEEENGSSVDGSDILIAQILPELDLKI